MVSRNREEQSCGKNSLVHFCPECNPTIGSSPRIAGGSCQTTMLLWLAASNCSAKILIGAEETTPKKSCMATELSGVAIRLCFCGNCTGGFLSPQLDILKGNLDLMVLKTLEVMGALHGYGIARRIDFAWLPSHSPMRFVAGRMPRQRSGHNG
jgi:hypothetical protein